MLSGVFKNFVNVAGATPAFSANGDAFSPVSRRACFSHCNFSWRSSNVFSSLFIVSFSLVREFLLHVGNSFVLPLDMMRNHFEGGFG